MAHRPADAPTIPRARVPWKAAGTLAAVLLALSAIAEWRDSHALLINRTDSLPNWAFFVSAGSDPARGDYLSFVPPPHPLVARHFGDVSEPWGKIVYGMPGDQVRHSGGHVTVNGRVVGRMKPRTRFGEALTPGPVGRIPAGCYYAGTTHPDGFDSRYAEIGFVCRRQIVGIGIAIL